MFVTKESKTKNYKENILVGFEAVTHVVQLLFQTPRISLPYALGIGFELKDLLFKEAATEEYQTSVNSLKDQIRKITGNTDMDVNVKRNGTTTEVILTVNVGNEETTITVPVTDDKTIRFKDITVE